MNRNDNANAVAMLRRLIRPALVCLGVTWLSSLQAATLSPKGAGLFSSVRMVNQPTPPRLVVVPPSVVTVTRPFAWSPSVGADWYTLYGGISQGTPTWPTNATGTNATMTLTIPNDYAYLYWVVRASNIAGQESFDSNEVREPGWGPNALLIRSRSIAPVALETSIDLKSWVPAGVTPQINTIVFTEPRRFWRAVGNTNAVEAVPLWLWDEEANHFGGN